MKPTQLARSVPRARLSPIEIVLLAVIAGSMVFLIHRHQKNVHVSQRALTTTSQNKSERTAKALPPFKASTSVNPKAVVQTANVPNSVSESTATPEAIATFQGDHQTYLDHLQNSVDEGRDIRMVLSQEIFDGQAIGREDVEAIVAWVKNQNQISRAQKGQVLLDYIWNVAQRADSEMSASQKAQVITGVFSDLESYIDDRTTLASTYQLLTERQIL